MLKCLVDLSNYYLLFLHKSLYFYCFYFEFQGKSVNLFEKLKVLIINVNSVPCCVFVNV